MKIWRLLRLLTLVIVAISVATPALAAPVVRDWKAIRIGIDPANPPFSSIDGDQGPSGFDIAIAKALCDRLKARCDFVTAARGALLNDLLAHKSDAVIASLTITDEARKSVDFTDKYYSTDARFAVAKTSGLTTISPETLHGRSIGALEGSPYGTYLTETYAAKGVTVKLYKGDAEAHADLRDGRVAVLFGNAIRLYRWLDDGAGGRCCRFIGADIHNPKLLGDGAGIAIRKEDGDLRDLINRTLADILRDGTYEKINAMYFNFLIY